MARITMDIPREKMQLFLMLVMQLGLDATAQPTATAPKMQYPQQQVAYAAQQNHHPYYDWDFYSNELEFE